MKRTLLMRCRSLLAMLAFLCLFTALFQANGQQVSVSGQVTDAVDGSPLTGTAVLAKGTTTGTVTDGNGNFALSIDAGGVLVFSFIGYLTHEEPLNGRTLVNVTMNPDTRVLDEVVVTALGIERSAKSLGYATQQVSGEEFQRVKDPNLLNNLSGRVAGVTITQGNSGVGSSAKMTIRGEASLSGDNQPLFIVDGVPINNYTNPSVTESSSSGPQEVDYGNGAGDINPDDIESITVLKGATSAALYGSRAGNGVVLITTKSGKGRKGIGVSFNNSTTFENVLVIPRWQNAFGQGSVGTWDYEDGNGGGINDAEDLSWGPAFDGTTKYRQFDGPSMGIVNGQYVPVRGGDLLARQAARDAGLDASITPTDWYAKPDNVKDFFQTGMNLANNLSLTGANDKGHFRLSFTNLKADGVYPNNNMLRNTIALNSGYRLSSKLEAGVSANYITTANSNRPSMGYGSENPMYVFAWYGRQLNTASLRDYWQAGAEGRQQYNYNTAWHDNPYLNAFENTNSLEKNRMLGNVLLKYNFTNALSLQLRSGVDWFRDNRVSKRVYSSQRFPKGMYREDDVYFEERNTDFLLNYNKMLTEQFAFTATFGGNRMDRENTFTSNIANQLSVPEVYSLNNSAVALAPFQYDSKKRINSLYAMTQFAFREMLFLDLTGRNDWSSTLPNPYFYPSISLSGVVSEMVELPAAFSFAKIRVGYAEVGNDTEPYRLLSTYRFGKTYNNLPALFEQHELPNAGLVPERQKSFESGADIRMFNGRIALDLTWFNTLSENQIIKLPTSLTSGYEGRIINAGKIKNNGVELMLTLQPVKLASGFTWEVQTNFSKLNSKVLSISEGMDEYVYAATTVYNTQSAQVFAMAKVGDRMGNIYGTGFQKHEGKIVYANGLPVPDNELRLLGNYNPDYLLGFGSLLAYKGFSFDFLFDFRKGGVVVSRMFSIATTSGNLDHTTEGRSVADPLGNIKGEGIRWDETSQGYVDNDVYVAPQDFFSRFYHRNHEESSTFDATFLKLREVKLGYSLPSKLLTNTPVARASVSLVGRNLFLWTGQKYFDPETLTYEGENAVLGVEEMSYPSTRSYGFSVSLDF